MCFERLHERAMECVRKFKGAESELISILQQIDANKGFRLMGHASLFAYATRALGLSESHAYTLITVSRKSKEVPQLKQAIAEGVLTTNQARRISPVITQENQTAWIQKAVQMSQRELEKEIVKVAPQEAVRETVKYVAPTRMKLVCAMSERSMKRLQQVQNLVSQKTRRAATLEEALEELIEFYLERKDPLRRAAKALARPAQNSARYELGPRGTAVPARIKHEVMRREQGQCCFKMPDGRRCGQKRWLHFHHQQALADGGTHTADNLSLLCQAHHALEHGLRV